MILACLLCISPLINTYVDEIQTEPGIHVSILDPVYVWASYEAPERRVVGQYMPSRVYGAGLGFRTQGRVSVFLEAGYYWPETRTLPIVEREIIEQVLINDHGEPSFVPETYVYDIDPGWGGRAGVSLEVRRFLDVFAAYRFVGFDEKYAMCTGPRCKWPIAPRHWVNSEVADYSSFQVGFTIKIGQ